MTESIYMSAAQFAALKTLREDLGSAPGLFFFERESGTLVVSKAGADSSSQYEIAADGAVKRVRVP